MAKAFRTTLAALAAASAFALAAGALKIRQDCGPGWAGWREFTVIFGAVLAAFAGAAGAAAVSGPLLGSKRSGASRAVATATNAVLLAFSALVFWRAILPADSSWWPVAGLSAMSFLVIGAREAGHIYAIGSVRAAMVWLACSVGAFALAAPVLGLGLS